MHKLNITHKQTNKPKKPVDFCNRFSNFKDKEKQEEKINYLKANNNLDHDECPLAATTIKGQ